MVLLSIPYNKLPWLLLLANLIIGIENQILADLEKYTVHTWMEKQIGLLLSDHRYCIHRYIKYTLRYRGYSRFPYYISDVTRLYKTVTYVSRSSRYIHGKKKTPTKLFHSKSLGTSHVVTH